MPRTLTLTNHSAVRDWVTFRDGKPAVLTEHDAHGDAHARLRLAFRADRVRPPLEGRRAGIAPCSWDAWLAEFDRQQLALQVVDCDDDDIKQDAVRFVSRQTRH